jgi:hypothetical protein
VAEKNNCTFKFYAGRFELTMLGEKIDALYSVKGYSYFYAKLLFVKNIEK